MAILNVSRVVPVIAIALAACQGLEDFSRSVDEFAATIVPDSQTDSAPQPEAERDYQLGLKYMNGDGVPQSYARAAELFGSAAADGVPDAQFMLGLLLQTGRGVAKDEAAAATWFRRAADQNHAEAQFFLGAAHHRGRGVRQDDRQAAQWFQKAAAQGHTGAQYELGLSYATARGVAQDDRVALDWFEKAAALGHPEAQYFAGQSYTNGWGTTVDHAWAARWYGKAADQGLGKAQYMLGVAYATGLGLPRDDVSAHAWLSLAAKQNEPEAARLRDALARKMTSAALDQSNARVKRWRAAPSAQFADRPTIRFVQVALAELGFDPGSADGQMGQHTRRALDAYRTKAGLRENAGLTPAIVQRLKTDRLAGSSLAKSAR